MDATIDFSIALPTVVALDAHRLEHVDHVRRVDLAAQELAYNLDGLLRERVRGVNSWR